MGPTRSAAGCSGGKSPSPPVLPPSQARGGAGLAGGSVDSWSVARLSTRATMVSTQEAMVCASNNVLTSTIASSQNNAPRASDLTESPVSLTQRSQVQLTPRLLQLIRNSNVLDVDLSPEAGKENSRPLPGSGLFSGSGYSVDANLEPNDSDAEEITSDIHTIHPDQQSDLLQEQQLYNDQHQQRLPSFGKTSVIRETSLASQYLQSQQTTQFKQAIGLVNGPQDLKVYPLKQEVGYPNPENQEVSFSNVGLNIIPGLNIPSTTGLSIHPINTSSSVAHVPNIQTLSNSCLGLSQGTSVNISSNLGTFSTPTSSSSVIMDPQHLYQVAAAQQLVSLGQAAAAAHGGQPPPVAGLQLLNYANQNNSNANSNNGSSEHNLAVALATQNAGNNGEKSWPCPSCRIPFASAIELQAHLTTHTQKPGQISGQVEGRNIPCDVCGKLFATQDRMKAHMRSAHQTDKNCSCSICGSGFSYRCKLLDHMRTHSGDRPFHCDVCGRGFSQKNHLTRHTMIHTGERPFSCEFCGRGFYRKDKLTRHRRTHTGWPPGEAPKASNGEQVGMALALMNQSVQQPGNNGGNSGQQANGGAGRGGRRATINPVTCHCEICGRGFTERAHLARHHMIHTGETPFICPVCQKGFYRKDKLNGHMRTHTDPPSSRGRQSGSAASGAVALQGAGMAGTQTGQPAATQGQTGQQLMGNNSNNNNNPLNHHQHLAHSSLQHMQGHMQSVSTAQAPTPQQAAPVTTNPLAAPPPFPAISTGTPATMDQDLQQIIMNPIFRSQLPTFLNAAALQQVTQQAHQASQHLQQGGRVPEASGGSPGNPSPQGPGQPQGQDQCSPNPATPRRDKDQSPPPGTPQGNGGQSSSQNTSVQENNLIQAVARQALLQSHQTNSLLK